MNKELVTQSQLSSSKMGHEIFFLVIYSLRPFDISVGNILMECYLTEAITYETRNYFNMGHPVVHYHHHNHHHHHHRRRRRRSRRRRHHRHRNHHHHHHHFPSIDPDSITKFKWMWKSSHFRENKE